MGLLSNLDWGGWIYGLVAGAIGGGSAAVTGALAASAIDSQSFSFGSVRSFKLMGLMFAFSAVKDVFLYLKQNPLPQVVIVKTVATTEQLTPRKAVVTTVEQTTIAKAPPEPPPTPPVDQR